MLKKRSFLCLMRSITLSACGTLQVALERTPTPGADAGQVATIVAASMAALPTATTTPGPTTRPTPEAPGVLPRSLYYSARPDADGVTNRVVLRPDTFGVWGVAVWTPDGSAMVIIQMSENFDPLQLKLLLVPVDPSRPVVTLPTTANQLDGSSFRWGP